MEQALQELVRRLRQAYGEALRTVVLYGSAVSGEFQEGHSDLNLFYVLRRVGLEELEKSQGIAEWWRGQNHPTPLLLAEDELGRASDAFPIEFLDISERHRVLHGENLLAGVEVTPLYHRAQVEHELRGKLLRLRHRYALVHRDPNAVLRLMLEALPSFAALFRHALRAAGRPCRTRKAEIFEDAARHFGVPAAPFLDLLEVRAGRKRPDEVDARQTFAAYLAAVTQMTAAVDGLLVK